ncbi:A-kinase anchor protein 10, mitochondrial [Amphibalanus amphitrite]|uniref:A-kinase anchor protein 10, mitochondrial n=1 Tax=Amphibalanus amphitrite TaxID=1232801 RepID=A0A6A4W6H6_AMPAM|nr:A-kinase anchor protein 10, mitochondrial [Amphibalanus amphitrite]
MSFFKRKFKNAEKEHLISQRLTKTLRCLANDKCALGYLTSFLEGRHVAGYLHFWMEAEAIRRRLDTETTTPGSEPEPAGPRNGELPAAAALSQLLQRYLVSESGPQLRVPAELRAAAAAAAAAAGPEGGAGSELATRAQEAAAAALSASHVPEFLQSDHYQCYQVDVLTSSSVEICDILFNETVVFMFMEFMEQEGLAHYIEFWMSSNNFRDQLYALDGRGDPEQTQGDAMILYEKYFSLQAVCPLGFGQETRTELELNICREGGPLPECFLRPMLVLHNVLQQRYLAAFLNSQAFFKYVMGLVNTIRHPARPFYDKTDAVSTCSSDLASSVTGGSVPERWSHQDPGQLHRRRYYGLSIGHVNHVGRYESHLEPKPDAGRPSALRRAVKSLLRHDENKVQEEMAWRVANLIVKDVTSVTMGLGGGSPTHRPPW